MARRTVAILAALAAGSLSSRCPAAEAPAQRADALLKEARTLAQKSRNKLDPKALAKVEAAVQELDAAAAAGGEIGRSAFEGLKWAAQRAREDLGDNEKSLFLCRKMIGYGGRGNRKLDAQLEMALTYRAMRDFKKAQQLYDALAAESPRYNSAVLLPVAVMTFVEMGDKQRGRKLLEDALMNEDISNLGRYRVVTDLAKRALSEGRRAEAIAWYAKIEKMPDDKPQFHLRYLTIAWYEMGRIEESFGRTKAAKALYRKAMDLEGGDISWRVRARNAIESIEYFE